MNRGMLESVDGDPGGKRDRIIVCYYSSLINMSWLGIRANCRAKQRILL